MLNSRKAYAFDFDYDVKIKKSPGVFFLWLSKNRGTTQWWRI